MKKVFFGLVMALAIAGCKKDKGGTFPGIVSCNSPSTIVPEEMVGKWASGYNSSTGIVDTYNGQHMAMRGKAGNILI